MIISLCLTSCAPVQFAGTNKHGHPYAVQFAGFAHKMKGGVLRQKNGQIEQEQVLEEPDGTEVIKQISTDRLTLGLGNLLAKERVNANNNKTKVELGAQNLEGKKFEIQNTVPNPNDGNVEVAPEP